MQRLTGLVGYGIGHSLSPALFARAFHDAGLMWSYGTWEISPSGLGELLSTLRDGQVAGFNVTRPHKEAVARAVDEWASSAREVGAVNAVVRRGRRWIGHNTDRDAFARELMDAGWISGLRAATSVVLGAGGAAAACAAALARAGAARVVVSSRRTIRARSLARRLGPLFARRRAAIEAMSFADAFRAARGAALLVHATPAGGEGQGALSVPRSVFRPGLRVFDLVYRPAMTPLVRQARRGACDARSGGGMLLRQAEATFRLWTGRRFPQRTRRWAERILADA